MRFRILPPVGNTRGPLYVESLLSSMHKALSGRNEISLRLDSVRGSVGYGADIPDEQRTLFLQELQDAYPGTGVRRFRERPTLADSEFWFADLRLCPDLLKIRTHDEFIELADDRLFADPVAGLLASIRSGRSGRVECAIDLSIRPARAWRVRAADRILRRFHLRHA